MKKLLIVTRSTVLHNQSGGLETQLNALVEYLKNYYKLTILTTALPYISRPYKINQIKIHNGVEYICLNNTIAGEYGFTMYESLLWQIPVKRNLNSFNKGFQKKAAKYYKKNLQGKYSLIVSQSSSAQNFNADIPIVSINHGTTINEIKSTYYGSKGIKDKIRFAGLNLPVLLFEYFYNNPRYFKKAAKIVLVSKVVQQDFTTQHKRFSNKTVVIENGVDTEKFKPNPIKYNSKPFRVIYFGRINFEKGLDDFIKVANKLPKVQFDIYGDGPNKKDIERLITQHKLKNTNYHGPVSNKQIAKILAVSHIFLFLTKRKEGMPMTILEAMSAGCVVISTLPNNLYPAVINVNSAQAASLKVEKLVKNVKNLQKLAYQSRELIVIKYSSKISGEKYQSVLNELLN